MHKRLRVAAAAVLASLPATAALAADEAGAARIQDDLTQFLADLESVLPLRLEPAGAVRVTAKGDAYLVEIAPLLAVVEGRDGPVGELHLDRIELRLVPDPADADITLFELASAPSLQLHAEGRVVAEIDFGSFQMSGRWSDALDQPIAYTNVVEEMRLSLDLTDVMPLGTASGFETTIGALEAAVSMSPQPLGLWSMRSVMRVEDVVSAFRPVSPDAEPVVFQRYETLELTSSVAGYPAAAWRDYVVAWAPLLLAAAAEGRELEREELADLVSELPVAFDTLIYASTSTGVLRQGLAIEREEQRLEIRGASLDVLDLSSTDMASGITYADVPGDNPALDELIVALVPQGYSSSVSLTAVPLGHAVSELIDTADAWIGDPMTAADIFWRSFISRAGTLASSGELNARVDWADAALTVTAALEASSQATLGVAGSVDGAFTGMDAIGARLFQSPLPEAGATWSMLQALGQREETPEGVVIRYRVDIAPDGAVRFNGVDMGPVLRMVEGWLDDVVEAFEDGFIPDQF